MASGIFVSGTDTDVGKTAVSVAVLRQGVSAGLVCRACKPVASGVGVGVSDATRLWQATAFSGPEEAVCPQTFAAAAAPEQAAAAEGRHVDEALLRTCLHPHAAADLIVVEGAGGLFSPLSPNTLNADLARELGLPVVLVDTARLGLIGRTLASVTAARAVGLTVAAVVISEVTAVDKQGESVDSPAVIARASLADLRRRLPDLPVGWLGHKATQIDPLIDWQDYAAPLSLG